jgi:hypothetical protein
MNILFIANINSVHTYRFVKEFAGRGYFVFILSIAQNKKLIDYDNIAKVIDLNYLPELAILGVFIKFVRYHIFSFSINRIIKKYEIEGVLSVNLAYGCAIASNIKKPIKKIGITLGDDFEEIPFYNPEFYFKNKKVIRKTISKLNYIVTGDEELYSPLLKKNNWFFENKFLFLGTILGVDIDNFNPRNKNTNFRKELYNINKDDILAMCFREPNPKLDFENIIRAIAKLLNKYVNLYFVIGKGNKDCLELKDLSKRLGIEANILFVGNIKYTELGNYLAQGDIFIDPVNIKKNSLYAYCGVSQALIESMACGLIPVISNRPSIKWILPPEADPFIYEDFENDLHQAIERAIKEKDNENIKLAMRNAVIEKANKEIIIDTIVSLFGE